MDKRLLTNYCIGLLALGFILGSMCKNISEFNKKRIRHAKLVAINEVKNKKFHTKAKARLGGAQ